MSITDDRQPEGGNMNRRQALECMVWAGTGLVWTLIGGVPRSLNLIDSAAAASARSFSFVQISDTHIGFDKAANPDVVGTLRQAIGKVNALPARPAFMVLPRPGSIRRNV